MPSLISHHRFLVERYNSSRFWASPALGEDPGHPRRGLRVSCTRFRLTRGLGGRRGEEIVAEQVVIAINLRRSGQTRAFSPSTREGGRIAPQIRSCRISRHRLTTCRALLRGRPFRQTPQQVSGTPFRFQTLSLQEMRCYRGDAVQTDLLMEVFSLAGHLAKALHNIERKLALCRCCPDTRRGKAS
jgi:hypothetical protein